VRRVAEDELKYGHLYDLGYMEFACSQRTYEWLAAGAMTSVNGKPCSLYVADRMPGGHNVIVQVRFPDEGYKPGTYAWQKTREAEAA
jgi:hypothetical protein